MSSDPYLEINIRRFKIFVLGQAYSSAFLFLINLLLNYLTIKKPLYCQGLWSGHNGSRFTFESAVASGFLAFAQFYFYLRFDVVFVGLIESDTRLASYGYNRTGAYILAIFIFLAALVIQVVDTVVAFRQAFFCA